MEIAENVNNFLNWCSTEIGKYNKELFEYNIWNEYEDLDIRSPIEQILYTAINTIMKLNNIPDAEPHLINNQEIILGLGITPQAQIDKYRVDFKIYYGDYKWRGNNIKAIKKQQNLPEYILTEIVIECDSQEFHERTEKERRYEKRRDRYIQSQGYTVFRYTGSEIQKNSMRIAAEIISFLTYLDIENIQLDSNCL